MAGARPPARARRGGAGHLARPARRPAGLGQVSRGDHARPASPHDGAGGGSRRRSRRRSLLYGPARTCPRLRGGARRRPGGRRCSRTPEFAGVGRRRLPARQPALRGSASVLVQRYVEGTAASVSLLVAGGRSTALSLNGQRVRAGIPFAYDGGVASVSHPRRAEACELAQRAVALVPGLRGYVGVDLVLDEEICWLIEINPRPTTSYVGLRRVIDLNMAAAIWRACRDGSLPAAVNVPPPAVFGKRWADES